MANKNILIMKDFARRKPDQDRFGMAQAAMLGFEVAVMTVIFICWWHGA